MTLIRDIYQFLDEFSPFNAAFSYDNCGLLVGNFDNTVNKVLLSLDITKNVIKEAKGLGAELIISHHPIIFKPIKFVNSDSALHLLCELNISAICAHTNLDVAKEGVNYQLAKALMLKNLKPLTYEENSPLGFLGTLEKTMTCKEFANYVKKQLRCDGLRYTKINRPINTVAVCSGSGGNLVDEVAAKNADVFVTGEIKHSQILQANELNIAIVDAGHYRTENVIISPLTQKLRLKFKNVEFLESRVFTDNMEYI